MKDTNEYLRRNLLLAKAVGASSGGCTAALERLKKTKRPQKWLIKLLEGSDERVRALIPDLVKYRNQVQP